MGIEELGTGFYEIVKKDLTYRVEIDSQFAKIYRLKDDSFVFCRLTYAYRDEEEGLDFAGILEGLDD